MVTQLYNTYIVQKFSVQESQSCMILQHVYGQSIVQKLILVQLTRFARRK